MDSDYGSGRRRLPGYDDSAAEDARSQRARADRDQGVRRVRRMSNWTAAALVAGVAVTSGYFAHAATVATPVPGSASTGQQGAANSGHKPSLSHPVVTSGGSGVIAGSGGAGGAGSGGAGSGWRDN